MLIQVFLRILIRQLVLLPATVVPHSSSFAIQQAPVVHFLAQPVCANIIPLVVRYPKSPNVIPLREVVKKAPTSPAIIPLKVVPNTCGLDRPLNDDVFVFNVTHTIHVTNDDVEHRLGTSAVPTPTIFNDANVNTSSSTDLVWILLRFFVLVTFPTLIAKGLLASGPLSLAKGLIAALDAATASLNHLNANGSRNNTNIKDNGNLQFFIAVVSKQEVVVESDVVEPVVEEPVLVEDVVVPPSPLVLVDVVEPVARVKLSCSSTSVLEAPVADSSSPSTDVLAPLDDCVPITNVDATESSDELDDAGSSQDIEAVKKTRTRDKKRYGRNGGNGPRERVGPRKGGKEKARDPEGGGKGKGKGKGRQ